MNRALPLRPAALFVSIALGCAVLVAMGQAVVRPAPLVRYEYLGHPRDMIQVREGTLSLCRLESCSS